jgi:hypothetical protein
MPRGRRWASVGGGFWRVEKRGILWWRSARGWLAQRFGCGSDDREVWRGARGRSEALVLINSKGERGDSRAAQRHSMCEAPFAEANAPQQVIGQQHAHRATAPQHPSTPELPRSTRRPPPAPAAAAGSRLRSTTRIVYIDGPIAQHSPRPQAPSPGAASDASASQPVTARAAPRRPRAGRHGATVRRRAAMVSLRLKGGIAAGQVGATFEGLPSPSRPLDLSARRRHCRGLLGPT